MSFFRWVSLGHSTAVGFAKLIFTSWIQISALIPQSRHFVTLATPRVVPVRRTKVWRKVVPPARVTLPAEVRQLVHSIVSPPLGVIHINGCLNFTTTQVKVNSPRVTPGEGCLRYPRPYKWGLKKTMTVTARGRSRNKRFNEQNNGCPRASTTTWNDQFPRLENVNRDELTFISNLSLCPRFALVLTVINKVNDFRVEIRR